MELTWTYKHFNKLSATELYAIMQLRNAVFVVEQNCVYQDADDKDLKSWHLAGWDGGKLVAYCRILPAGLSYNHPSIGRVVSSPDYRKGGFGRELMQKAVVKTIEEFADPIIIISAQLYLQKFYESIGFVKDSDTYLEDDIPHIRMQFGA
jgi:ElaA protein